MPQPNCLFDVQQVIENESDTVGVKVTESDYAAEVGNVSVPDGEVPEYLGVNGEQRQEWDLGDGINGEMTGLVEPDHDHGICFPGTGRLGAVMRILVAKEMRLRYAGGCVEVHHLENGLLSGGER